MANPSLQIGNSNWAIKEDNLLGYSTAGTRFVPQPITMTRASAGTRVNSSGLVETVELLGSELVDDGNFPLPNTEWDLTGEAEVTALGGRIYSSSGGVSSLDQGIGMVVGKNYKITLDVIATNGTKLSNPSGTNIYDTSTVGSKVFYITAAYSTLYFKRYSGITDVTINNVSVKESTKNNLARVDYDGTASSLLVEPERTNLIPYSEDFSQWGTQDKIILTPNSVSSPSGDVNAYKIIPTSTSGVHKVRENLSTVSGDYTLSIFAKQGEYKNILLWDDILSGGLGVNLDDLSIFRNQNNQSYNIEDYGSGWVRISVTLSYSSQQILPSLYIYDNSATPKISFAGNDIDGLYIWGSQVEVGSYPTSYIPNFGTAAGVTRNQDIFTRDGIGSLINSTEGVLFVEMAALSNDGTYRLMNIRDVSNTDNFIYLGYKDASNTIRTRIEVGGVASTDMEFVLSNETEFNKIAIKWKTNDFALWVNGVEVATDSSGVSFTANTLDKLSFDRNGGLKFNGKVKQLQVFKTALTDSELATLTTI